MDNSDCRELHYNRLVNLRPNNYQLQLKKTTSVFCKMAITFNKAKLAMTQKVKNAVKTTFIRRKGKVVDPIELTKKQKREKREQDQRIHAAAKARLIAMLKGMQDARRKTTGLCNKRKFGGYKNSKQESALLHDMQEAKYQSGKTTFAIGATVTATAVAAATYQVVKSFSKVADKAGKASESVSTFVVALEQALRNFIHKLESLGGIFWKTSLGLVLSWILSRVCKIPIAVTMLGTLCAQYVPEIKAYVFGDGIAREQSGTNEAANFIAMVCTCWIPGRDVKAVTGEFLKRATYFPRAAEGIESFLTKALSLLEKFVNFVLKRSEDKAVRFVSTTNALQVWIRKAVGYCEKLSRDVTLNLDELREIRSHYLLGYGFYEVAVTEVSKRELKQWMEKLGLAIRPHEGAISKMTSVRPMPVCVMLGGASGVGKTSLVRYLSSLILLLSGECKASEALQHMWQKGTTQYWNGWVGQKCLVIDDAFQVKPKPGDYDSEGMQIIRTMGNFAFPLNFADLDSKGKFYFDAPLVVGTTNCSNIRDEWAPFITEPLALVRRFQFSYWVSVSEEYKDDNDRLMYDKLAETVRERVRATLARTANGEVVTEEEILDIIPWNAWELRTHGFCGPQPRDGPTHSLRDVVLLAADAIKQRKAVNSAEVQDLDDILALLEKTRSSESVPTQVQVRADGVHTEPIPGHINADERVVRTQAGGKLNSHRLNITRSTLSMEELRPLIDSLKSEPLDDRDYMEEFMSEVVDVSDLTDASASVIEESRAWTTLHYMRDSVFEACKAIYRAVLGDVDTSMGWRTIFKMVGVAAIVALGVKFIVTAASAVAGFVSALFTTAEEPAREQSNVGNGVKTKATHKHNFATIGHLTSVAKLQVGTPPQEGVRDKVYNNTFKLVAHKDGATAALGQIIGVCEDVFIFPKHFLLDIKENYADWCLMFYHARPTSDWVVSMTAQDFLKLRMVQVDEFDLAAVAFGRAALKSVANITHLFLEQSVISKRLRGTNNQVALHVFSWGLKDGKVIKQRDTISSMTCESYSLPLRTERGNVLTGLVKYQAPTRDGDCGAPVVGIEDGGACIYGFHSAGRTFASVREGFGTIVTREVVTGLVMRLKTYTDLFGSNEVREATGEEEEAAYQSGLAQGSMYVIGKVIKPVSQATVSKLQPSIMQAEQVLGEPFTDRAILRPVMLDDEVVYPSVIAIQAYQSDQTYMDPEILNSVVDMSMSRHWERTNGHMAEVLSFEEALQPSENLKLKALNRRTSPGFKYRDYVTATKPGKTFALGFEGDIDFTRVSESTLGGETREQYANPGLDVLYQDVMTMIHEAKQDRRLMHLCVDFLKDELRPLEKVKNVKTRAISGAEMDYTVAVRMYFGAFMAATFATHTNNGMAPGINHYTEWGVLATNLLSKGDAVFDGDFSRFDASEQPWIHEAILSYINRWYRRSRVWKEEDERVRNILWLDLVHSRHISGLSNKLDTVVQWNKSLPSGHPLTTIVNSMYSLITLGGCYVSLTSSFDMWDHCFVCTFGDDNISSVDDTVRDVFNQVTVAQKMKELFNLDYTPGNKGGELVKWSNIKEVTFLKRSFAEDEVSSSVILRTPFVEWVAPLDPKSFLQEGYWFKNVRDPMGDVQERLSNTLYELSIHPPHMWERWAPILLKWADDKGVPVAHRSREACRHHLKTRFDVWF